MALSWAVLALAWLVGVALQLTQARLHPGVAVWAGVAAVATAALCAGSACRPMRAWLRCGRWAGLLAGVALAGWAMTEWRAEQRWQAQWPAAWSKRDVMLTGRVVGMPLPQTWGLAMTVEVQAIEDGAGRTLAGQPWHQQDAAPGTACPERVSLIWPWPAEATVREHTLAVVPGQVWRWPVRLHQPDGLLNPGGYEAELAQFERGVRAAGAVRTGHGEAAARPVLLRPPAWHDGQLIERWRTKLRDRVLAVFSDQRVAGFIVGLTIGEQSAITADDWDTMRVTGTAHLAAISGLHVTMMGWMLGNLVSAGWRRSRRLTAWWPAPSVGRWMGLGGAWVYAMLSGWGLPAQRTVLMLAVFTLLQSVGRRWPWPLYLLAAAVVVTVLDPWALLQAGFWLSFAAVGLLLLSGGDDETRVGLDTSRWWRRWWLAAGSLLRTQSVASIGLAPLSIVFFQSCSLVGLLANLVCIPLFTLVITPLSMLGLAWSGCWVPLASVLNHTMDALTWLGAHPWALWQSPGVAAWASALGLLGGACLLAPLAWRWRLLAVPATLPLLWPTPLSQAWPAPMPGHVAVMAADIGQGSAIVVRTAHHALLFDTGPGTSPELNAGRRVLAGLLRTLGVARLDAMVISHGDNDHIGGAASLLKAVKVDQLISSLPAGHSLLGLPSRHGTVPPHVTCVAGQRWAWDGVSFEVLQPTADDLTNRARLSDNAMSCVLRVEAAGKSVLLTGDIEKAQEAALVQRLGSRLRSDVLLVPHHGSQTSSTPDFLAQVRPEVAVIQVGARNRYGHPAPKVLARYRSLRIPALTSPDCGAWAWRSDEKPVQGDCWREQARRYWLH